MLISQDSIHQPLPVFDFINAVGDELVLQARLSPHKSLARKTRDGLGICMYAIMDKEQLFMQFSTLSWFCGEFTW